MGQMIQTAFVGGWPGLVNRWVPRLKENFGIDVKWRLGTNPGKSNTRIKLPTNCELVLFCRTNISHPAGNPIMEQAKSKGVKLVSVTKSWSETVKLLHAQGYQELDAGGWDSAQPWVQPWRRDEILLQLVRSNPDISSKALVKLYQSYIAEHHPENSTRLTSQAQAIARARKVADGRQTPSKAKSAKPVVVKESKKAPKKTPKKRPSTVAPAVVAVPAPAPVETDWRVGDLRSAVQLVIEQMKSKHVVELTIQADGTVHYRREIIEHGTIEL